MSFYIGYKLFQIEILPIFCEMMFSLKPKKKKTTGLELYTQLHWSSRNSSFR